MQNAKIKMQKSNFEDPDEMELGIFSGKVFSSFCILIFAF